MCPLPLSDPSESIAGNYSSTNFPAQPDDLGHKFHPVVVKFKLKSVEQTVNREARINSGVWRADNDDSDKDLYSYLSPPRRSYFMTLTSASRLFKNFLEFGLDTSTIS